MDDNKKCYWRQFIHAIPLAWKEMFLEFGDNISDFIINERYLIKKHQIYCLQKLNSRELYKLQLMLSVEKPTAQTYFEKKFKTLNWNGKTYIPYLDA